ncbi:multiple sugar transport system permease protein [Caldanaerobius fijiensis DSM 17918]|uniref:Multiple sugar transport system permease protein n=1 Tax=Caldanaerobius fijiensis DSM 17918 TaxID=1121256 RepID=A0A1M5EGB5_9THEO|nr:sugar ABC transporter permease [Caldanaerobius fijiensis]SHF78102.1 multiple sugar transport system permease protein [Caldanaerobius fijiensis DSM 17918]
MLSKFEKREQRLFYIFIAPWIIGFIVFTLYPLLSSLYLSFTQYDIVNAPKYVGLQNFKDLFHDELFYRSIKATLYYTLVSVPVGLILSICVALLVNQKVPGQRFFRTAIYLPTVVGGVAMSLLWLWILNPDLGILNYLLQKFFHIKGPQWLLDEKWAIPSLILMSLWGVGQGMVIFLASLQGVPKSLYEAALLDGANSWQRFWNVTFPMISPVVLFQLITGIIGSFQVFTQAFVMTQGGPHYATLFYVYYLYQNAFSNFKVGYASAMAWLLLVSVAILTYIIMKFSNSFVYYEGGKN